MVQVKVSNLVKFYAVLLLLEKPLHGYDLMKEIGVKLSQKVSPGQIYPFLSSMQKNGLVKAAKKGTRDKIYYTLTAEGKTFAEAMLGRFGSLIEIAMKPHITICTHCSCKVFEGGVVEKINGKKLKFCCMHCVASWKKHAH